MKFKTMFPNGNIGKKRVKKIDRPMSLPFGHVAK